MKQALQNILKERTDIHAREAKIDSLEKRITTDNALSEKNRALLLSYNAAIEKEFSKRKISISGWQKNLEEAYAFTKKVGVEVAQIDKKDIEKWYAAEEKRFISGERSAWTLLKYYSQVRKFLCFAHKIPEGTHITWYDWLKKELPDKPKNTMMAKDLPTQEKVKNFLVAIRNQGNKSAIRNAAIIALCNDVGCRISEALSVTNNCVQQEKNYLVVTLPQSKTTPRSVIAFISKPYIEEWEKISPNRDKPGEALFFCDKKGEAVKYASLYKQLNLAAARTSLVFPKNKATHLFRKIFASRSYNWPDTVRKYWLGWSGGISDVYTTIDHRAAAPHYFKMLEDEQNPMYNEKPLWKTSSMNSEEYEAHKKMILAVLRGEFTEFDKRFEKKVLEVKT